jgi:c-di-GMP-binding flagellar brake protein YcgR
MVTSFSGRLDYEEDEDRNKETASGEERRRAPRFPHVLDLSYEVVSLPDEQTIIETLDRLLEAQSADVSATGISLWTNRLLTPGTTIGMNFPSETTMPKIKAKVVWCQPQTTGGTVRVRLGLEFIEVDETTQAKIKNLVDKAAASETTGN